MRIKLLNTAQGLKPLYDEDFEEKRKLKLGASYIADVKLLRNVQFHRKAFALLNTAWSYLPEATQNGFRSLEGFRAYLTVAAGFYDVYYNHRLAAYVEAPKSWKFDSMDEAEFGDLYERMKDVIWGLISDRVSEEEFMSNLSNF